MAKKISDLPGAGSLTGAEQLELAQSGVSKSLSLDDLVAFVGGGGIKAFVVAISDETTPLTTGAAKLTFRMPYAMTLTAVRLSLRTAQATNGAGGILTVDINEGGASILSTKLTVDNTEKTSTTAATPAVISDSSLADDAEVTIDVDQVGDGTATGGKVTFIGF